MNIRKIRPLSLCLVLMASAAATPAFAQQSAKPADAKQASNLSGVWIVSGGGGGGGGSYQSNPQSEWSAEALPFTPKGLEVFQANKPGKGPRQVPIPQRTDPISGANPMGLYRTLVYSRPVEFVQLPGKLIQLFGWGRIWREIYTDGRPVPADVPQGPFWYGYSVGRWEGDTLVATTLALDGRAWLDEWGTPISDDARVEERWQRVAPDKIQLKITVHDPAYYSKPWTSSPINYKLLHGVDPEEIILSPIDENTFNQTIRDPAGSPPKK
jgi:hypothetical protein